MNFFCKFRKLLLIFRVAGIYVASESPKLNLKLLPISVAANVMQLFTVADEIYCIFFQEMPAILNFFLGFCAFSFFWSWVKNCYFLYSAKENTKLLTYWSDNLITELWPDIREKEINLVYKKMMRSAYISILVWCVPLIVAGIVKVFWTLQLFVPSAFLPNPLDLNGPFLLVLFQCITVYWLCIGETIYESYVLLIINLILGEYNYLETTLTKIMDLSENSGKILESDLKFDSKRKLKLSQWLNHHVKVIEFLRKFEKTFAPILSSTYLYIILNVCGLLFCSSSGQIPLENVFYCYVFIGGHMVMKYRLCRCGDQISEMSSKLGILTMSVEWNAIPLDVRRTLLIINAITRPNTSISLKGITPINSQSFRKMIFLQYRFYTFMSDTQ